MEVNMSGLNLLQTNYRKPNLVERFTQDPFHYRDSPMRRFTKRVAECCEEIIDFGDYFNGRTATTVIIPIDVIIPFAKKHKLKSKRIYKILNGLDYEKPNRAN